MSRRFEKQEIFKSTFPQATAASFSQIAPSNGVRTSNGLGSNFSCADLWKTSPAAGPRLSASTSARGQMKAYPYIAE